MNAKPVKNKGILPAAIGLSALVFFLIYSVWMLSRPEPVEVQGMVESTQVKVASKIPGRIDSLAVEKGQQITKGQLLFTLVSPEVDARLEQASAALKAAQAQNAKAIKGADNEDIEAAYDAFQKANAALELAEKTFNRMDNLHKDGVIPTQKLDEAEGQLKAARETVNAASAVWQKAKNGTRSEDKETAEALVEKARAVINEIRSFEIETNIYAPISGEVANVIAERGELISSGYPVITLADLADSWITLNLREDFLADIKMGSTFKASIPALKNREIELKVTYISPLGNFATWNATKTTGDFDMKTFEIYAKPTQKVEGLRPGMSALIDWTKLRRANK
ncbi:MAG: efflux RND transporter periplasmic adaptor subunit [Bacteroidetes bacterium]|nr:efflux RND transporter periplasmic adaptor subunit [Bacteroidota bacterium]